MIAIETNSNLLPTEFRPNGFVRHEMIELDDEVVYQNSIWNKIDDDDIDLDYDSFKKQLWELSVEYYIEELNDYLVDTWVTISKPDTIEILWKRESVNFIINVDKKKLLEYIDDNQFEIHGYVQENYTSRDGFMSHTPNTVQENREKIMEENDDRFNSMEHSIMGVVSYVLDDSGLDWLDMYSYVGERMDMTEHLLIKDKR